MAGVSWDPLHAPSRTVSPRWRATPPCGSARKHRLSFSLCVERVDDRLVALLDDAPLHAELRRQLTALDREVVLEKRHLFRHLETGESRGLAGHFVFQLLAHGRRGQELRPI